MKFLLIIACLLFAPPAWAAIATDGTPAADYCLYPCNQIITGNVNSIHAMGMMVISIRTTTLNDTTATVTDDKKSSWSRILAANTVTNGANFRVELWASMDILGANAVITADFTNSRLVTSATAFYSGVAALGINTNNSGTGMSASVDLTTQDANNFVVAGCLTGRVGSFAVSAGTGNLRAQLNNDDAANYLNAAVNDNTAASPGSVTNAVAIDSSVDWVCGAVELRTSAATTRRPIMPILFQ